MSFYLYVLVGSCNIAVLIVSAMDAAGAHGNRRLGLAYLNAFVAGLSGVGAAWMVFHAIEAAA